MITVAVVALGAALGAPLRFVLERRFATGHFPSGLLVVNVLGSVAAGIVMAGTSGVLQSFLMIGFCGALTTYSGFAWQAAQLWRQQRSLMWVALVLMTAGCSIGFWLAYEATITLLV
jgi:fluoride exporter